TDKCDGAMAEPCKMLNGLANSFRIVDPEHANIRKFGCGIHKDHGKGAVHELLDRVLFNAERHDCDSVDAALQHPPKKRFGTRRIVVCGSDEDLVALLDGKILKLLDELGEEWIGDVRTHESQDMASARDQGTGLGVGNITCFTHSIPNPLCQLWRDRRDAVYRPRNGGDGNTGALSHVADTCGRCTQPVWI